MKDDKKSVCVMKKVEQKVFEFIAQYGLIKEGDNLLIALSGGPDSVFALYLLNRFKKKFRINLTALHFNHSLRGKESDDDQSFVSDFCEKLGVPCHFIKLDVKSYARTNKYSIEESARLLRYQNLQVYSAKLKCNKVVTAHNQNDNTETVLMNLLSGTGAGGFTGIPVKRGNIIRPLMCLTKEEILEYLNQSVIPFRIDSSNLQSDFKRNFIRNNVIPLLKEKVNPSLDAAVFRSSKTLESTLKTILSGVSRNAGKFIVYADEKLKISNALFEFQEESIAGEFLKESLARYYNYQFNYSDLSKLIKLSRAHRGKSVQLRGDFIAVKETDSIFIFKNSGIYEEQIHRLKEGSEIVIGKKRIGIKKVDRSEVRYSSKGNVEYISADKSDGMFILRKWKSGDRFIPLGMKEFKKVSDFLTGNRISSVEKKNQLLLVNRNNIVWIIGLRIDDRYKINPKTKKIYKLWMK